jgi:hypothetical protein
VKSPIVGVFFSGQNFQNFAEIQFSDYHWRTKIPNGIYLHFDNLMILIFLDKFMNNFEKSQVFSIYDMYFHYFRNLVMPVVSGIFSKTRKKR